MSKLIPNLELLLNKLDKGSLAAELVRAFDDQSMTVDEAKAKLKQIAEKKIADAKEKYGET